MTATTPAAIDTAIIEAIGPIPFPLTPARAADYYDRRAAFCLEAADTSSALAQQIAERGDHTAALALLSEAAAFLAEWQRINAMLAAFA
ncbi:Uncharacterised protein [Mycobacteroides abscessus subsp. abscessus]|nr:Uncharacterised protein [Mycobacteroides abscessus subsp. abscessus]